MKTLFKILAALLLGVVLLVVALPFLVPVDYIVDKVSESVEKTTGRALVIKGDKTLSIFPSLKLELNEVHFTNIKGSKHADMVSMSQLAIQIPYLSAISGDIQLEKFVIRKPNIILEKMANGKVNWQLFDGVNTIDNQQQATKGSTQLPQGFDISLGEVAIYDATITYIDHQEKVEHKLTNAELAVELPSLYQPLQVSGELDYQGQTFKLQTHLNTLAKAISSEDFSLGSEINSQLFSIKFDGQVAKAGQDFSGTLDLKGDSVKNILAWQKVALSAKEQAFNAFELAATMHFANQKLTLSKLTLALDELAINGQATVDLAKKLVVNANVDLGMLNLNPYLSEKPTQAVVEGNKKQPAKPIVWDGTPIDLSSLNSLNADIKVRSTGLVINEIKLDENVLALNIKEGLATINLTKFGLYEGKGVGKVQINALKKPYQVSTEFKLTDISALPLLTDAVGFDKLMGKGNLEWQLTTTGTSQKEFVNALNGTTAFSFNDGAVKGANIAALVRKAKDMLKGDLSAAAEGLNAGFDKSEKTDFSALTGSFTFNQGIGTNSDLALVSPLIRVSGSGDVNMPLTTVNYRLVTGIVDSIEGQGTTDKSTGFKVPVKIKGPFHDVKVQLDLSKAAEEETKNKVKDKVKDKLKSLFG